MFTQAGCAPAEQEVMTISSSLSNTPFAERLRQPFCLPDELRGAQRSAAVVADQRIATVGGQQSIWCAAIRPQIRAREASQYGAARNARGGGSERGGRRTP